MSVNNAVGPIFFPFIEPVSFVSLLVTSSAVIIDPAVIIIIIIIIVKYVSA